MRFTVFRIVALAACLALAACGSDAAEDGAVETTEAAETTETTAAPVAADSESTESESTESESTESEPAETVPEVADEPPVMDDLEEGELGEVEDYAVSASLFTASELDEAFPGEPWEVDASVDAGEEPTGIVLCGTDLPAVPDSLSADTYQSGGPTIDQQILLVSDPAWVEIFRVLDECDEAVNVIGEVDLDILPVAVDGATESIVVQAFEEELAQPHSIVVVTVTDSHTMLVSVEVESADQLDVDAIVALVEQAIARSN